MPRLPDRAALVMRPSGEIVEQLSGEPIERALSEAQGRERAADPAVGPDHRDSRCGRRSAHRARC